ncbi:hypothetical protein E1I69_03550 [Bacillus timonensis]|uniref:Uncharacterized protein n=1 Tax=Bacillus timonensis TaxID=1033734 RepID=A0A4S3PWW7_9BACI|nr:hypothetical protein E1I69_03550 [Bacillus timonensis]
MQGPSIPCFSLPFTWKKAKGEEKPEEELMGKRKSSPRLATTSSNDVVITNYDQLKLVYTSSYIFLLSEKNFC